MPRGCQMDRSRHWARGEHARIDYQDLHYYAAPKEEAGAKEPRRGRSGTAADLREAGAIPLEGAGHFFAGVDPGFDSRVAAQVAVGPRCSTASRLADDVFRETLSKAGVIFCPISEGGCGIIEVGATVSRKRGAGFPTTSLPR